MTPENLPFGFTITAAMQADVPKLVSIDRAASTLFEPTGLIHSDALDDTVPADVLEQALAVGHVFVAREQGGEPVGFTLTSQRDNTLYLDQVSVHPDFGQRGIGRALVIRILNDAEDRRLPDVTLSTFRDLPWNGPFYASLGFKEIPRGKLSPFMFEIEEAQSPFMNIEARCFMRRKVRRPLFRFKHTA